MRHGRDGQGPHRGGAVVIEIVGHRYHDWQAVGAPLLLADNAIHVA
jgi:hypothetical protein